jgi:hypothetical protein
MAVLDQIFFWSVVFVFGIEIILIVIVMLRKKRLISEDSRTVFEGNKILFLSAIGLLVVTLLFELIGEISELFEKEYPAIEFLGEIHMIVLLVSIVLIGWLTYKMVRGR